MKNAIITILVCVLLLFGCTSIENDLQPTADANVSTVKIELSMETVSISDLPMPMSYRLHNKNSKEITVEPFYQIEPR